ncbi:MAG: CBS domain-containing protein [Candidatus Aenigmarchaeota archaeon]|nr:CBS domain-containing protein [Candidatus Aenigmarchaeota archaeon]
MNLLDIAKPAPIIQWDESVSKAASSMQRQGVQDAFVFQGKELKGMLSAADLVKRNVNNPDRVQISGLKGLVRPVNTFPMEADVAELLRFLLLHDITSVPLKSGKKYYIIPKLRLLSLIGRDILKGKKASDVMFFPYTISPEDQLSVAHSIMRQSSVRRLVILKNRRAEGIVETMDILKTDINKKRMRAGEKVGEKIALKGIPASSLMQKVFLKVSPQEPLENVVKKMLSSGATTVVVEDEKFLGIITPATILKLAGRKVAGVYVSISGQQKEGPFIRAVIDEQLRNEIKKLGKFIPIDYLAFHIDRYKEKGKRVKYSLKARLITEKGMFFADDHAWDITQAVSGVLAKLEREVIKRKERHR